MIYTPKIIQETAQGLSSCNIEDRMLTQREIQLNTEVEHTVVTALVNQLLYLSRQNSDAPITLYINSPGGTVQSGMTLYDVMQAIPNPIYTVCTGQASSMAALLFAAGRYRSMLPHSKVMVHEPYGLSINGDLDRLHSYCEDLEKIQQDYCQLLAMHTSQPLEKIKEAVHKTTYFTAEEAKAFGLCDEIKTVLK